MPNGPRCKPVQIASASEGQRYRAFLFPRLHWGLPSPNRLICYPLRKFLNPLLPRYSIYTLVKIRSYATLPVSPRTSVITISGISFHNKFRNTCVQKFLHVFVLPFDAVRHKFATFCVSIAGQQLLFHFLLSVLHHPWEINSYSLHGGPKKQPLSLVII